MGRCPVCKRVNIPLTEHHFFKRAVFGDNGIIVYICRDCHDNVEATVREMENSILRAFIYCYRRINKGMVYQGKRFTPDELIEIILQGFAKINARSENPWLRRRIKTKAVSLRGDKKENGK
jgi:uncharacterized protein YlaI